MECDPKSVFKDSTPQIEDAANQREKLR